MITKTLLTDNSHWEGKINWELAAPNMGGAINKATEGLSFVDDQFANNKAGCIAEGEPNGAYHFFRPAYDPILQAQHFIKVVGSGIKVLACDVETALLALYDAKMSIFNSSTEKPKRMAARTDIDKLVMQSIIEQELGILQGTLKIGLQELSLPGLVEMFLDYVISYIPDCKPLFYTSPYFWIEHMKYSDGTYPNWNGKYYLWMAHYGVNEPMLPFPWTDYAIHQDMDKLIIPGISSYTDRDWMKGDQNNVNMFFGNGGISKEIVPQKYVYINTTALNMRSLPSANSKDLGTIKLNDDVPVIEEKNGWYRIEGWISKSYTRIKS